MLELAVFLGKLGELKNATKCPFQSRSGTIVGYQVYIYCIQDGKASKCPPPAAESLSKVAEFENFRGFRLKKR